MSNRSELARRLGLRLMPVEALAATSLAGRLMALGLPIISEDSVAAYKADKLEGLLKTRELADIDRRKASAKRSWLVALATFAIATIAVFALAGLAAGIARLGIVLALALAGIGVSVAFYRRGNRIFERAAEDRRNLKLRLGAKWMRTPLGDLHQVGDYADAPVLPREMQERARLAKTLPGVALLVDWLDTDPFLVVRQGGETAYIGVWDEDFVL